MSASTSASPAAPAPAPTLPVPAAPVLGHVVVTSLGARRLAADADTDTESDEEEPSAVRVKAGNGGRERGGEVGQSYGRQGRSCADVCIQDR